MCASNQVSFTRMDQGSFEDYKLLHDLEVDYVKDMVRHIIEELAIQGR